MNSNSVAAELYSPSFTPAWARYSLYELAAWVNGMAFKNFDFADSGLPVVKIAEIKSGITSQTRFTKAEYDPKYFLDRDDILFCWSGQPETSIDTFRWAGPPGWLNQHIFKVLPDEEFVDRDFFFHLMRYLKPTFIRIARNKQTTGLGHVTKGDLRQIQVAVPPMEVQRSIAAQLESIEQKIESNLRLQSSLESLAHAQFERQFSVEPEPRGAAIEDLIAVNPRRQLGRGEAAKYMGMSSLVEFSAEIYDWETKAYGSGQRFINGDVLLARITPCLENGKTAVVDMLSDGEVAWGSTEYIVLEPQGEFSTAWIYCLVRSPVFREFAIRSMTGSSGRQRLQPTSLKQYKIAQPAEAELKAFNRFSAPIFAKLTSIRDETLALRRLQASVLPEVMTGHQWVAGLQRALA